MSGRGPPSVLEALAGAGQPSTSGFRWRLGRLDINPLRGWLTRAKKREVEDVSNHSLSQNGMAVFAININNTLLALHKL